MIIKVVIAGCRDYNNYDVAKEYIDFCLSGERETNEIIVISGCALGADALGGKVCRGERVSSRKTSC